MNQTTEEQLLHAIDRVQDRLDEPELRFGQSALIGTELNYRQEIPPSLTRWLQDETSSDALIDDLVNELRGTAMAYEEARAFGESLQSGAARDSAVARARSLLKELTEMTKGEILPVDQRMERAEEWWSCLEALDPERSFQLRRKWPILTGPLMLCAPRQFPRVRPTDNNPAVSATVKAFFFDIEWQTGQTLESSREAFAETYRAYLERYELLEGILQKKFADSANQQIDQLATTAWVVAVVKAMKSNDLIDELVRAVRHRPVILQGPPGTGKTFAAEKLAERLTENGGVDAHQMSTVQLDNFDPDSSPRPPVVTHFVQFHASYDYEDFVRGFRPFATGDSVGFRLADGPFARMATLAMDCPDVEFLLVIDEINRADLARVLGECIYLLDRPVSNDDVEKVFLGKKPGAASLRYTATARRYGEPVAEGKLYPRICMPKNFLIVGTMNTADRSIAIVDVALRRRFQFKDLQPDPDVLLSAMRGKELVNLRKEATGWLHRLNGSDKEEALIEDGDFHVGHAYFITGNKQELQMRLRYQIVPLLREYLHEGKLDRIGGEKIIQEMLEFAGAGD